MPCTQTVPINYSDGRLLVMSFSVYCYVPHQTMPAL